MQQMYIKDCIKWYCQLKTVMLCVTAFCDHSGTVSDCIIIF